MVNGTGVRKAFGRSGEAGYDVNHCIGTVILVDARNQSFQQMSTAALHNENPPKFGNFRTNDAAQSLHTPAVVFHDLVHGFVLVSDPHEFESHGVNHGDPTRLNHIFRHSNSGPATLSMGGLDYTLVGPFD